jgi:ArsR family metal-binding transcriptional regulator
MLIQGYSDLVISTPDCMPGITIWTADFKLDADVSSLFPYINADIEKSAYYVEHPCILFELEGVRWSLYPDKASGLPFEDKDQAKGFIQRLIDYLNDLDERKDTIEPSDKTYKPIAVLDIFKCLPGTNCKKCEYATCMAFAAALSKGEVVLDQCLELEGFDNEKVAKLKAMIS